MIFELELSPEEKNLYNPAYVGVIIYHSIRECQVKNTIGLHCTLVYLTATLALSNRYSKQLPSNITTPIAGWFSENEGCLMGFSSSVNAYVDVVNTALFFLLEHKAIVLRDDGFFSVENDLIPKLPAKVKNNVGFKQGFQSAGFLGRWFACVDSPELIYTQLGVAP
jgi:hypothetical protein